MTYLTIKQIKDQYNIADKTIRRLFGIIEAENNKLAK